MDKVFIKDLKPAQNIRTAFLVKDKNLGTDKKGNSYLSVTLSDKTGHVDARVWDQAHEVNEIFEIDDFILVKGTVQKFQNRNQIVIHNVELIPSGDIQISDFLPVSKYDIHEMFQELMGIVGEVKNPFLKKLLENTLNDNEIQPLFKRCPAAKSVHHAFIGGLLEHTLSICKVMKLIASHYQELDLDLLLFGAIYHDIGKIWELSFDTKIGYTDVGRLIGHISLGSELVEKKANEIESFPFDLKNMCKHLVLSHHGQLEYGSPKRPKFLEALVVGMIDDLDSKINAIGQILLETQQSDPEAKWTPYNQMYDRYFYLKK